MKKNVLSLGLFVAVAASLMMAASGYAEEEVTNLSSPFPWYGSLKKTEVNVRSGPGNQYPILWIYQRPGYPVQVLTRYDNYYKIRDVEGEEGWTYVGMISRRTTGLVGGSADGRAPANLYRSASAGSNVVARLAPGLVVSLEECANVADVGPMCKVETQDGTKGWVAKRSLEMVQ